jgi:hypothetical protein
MTDSERVEWLARASLAATSTLDFKQALALAKEIRERSRDNGLAYRAAQAIYVLEKIAGRRFVEDTAAIHARNAFESIRKALQKAS